MEVAEKEMKALETMKDLDSQHIIKAIACYENDGKYFFVFPWAGEGNLRGYWSRWHPQMEEDYLQWVFVQLIGMAKAIALFHEKHNFRHGDLKPENVLCFQDKMSGTGEIGYGRLVITDFGLAKKHDKETSSRINATTSRGVTVMYAPPEWDSKKPRPRRYDVWSLGCIYLEFVIWLLWGNEQLENFWSDIQGKFYIEGNDGPEVHPNVKRWADRVVADPRCTEDCAVERLTGVITSQMLVVRIPDVEPKQGLMKPPLSPEEAKSQEKPLRHLPKHFEGIAVTIRAPTPKNDNDKTIRVDSKELCQELDTILNESFYNIMDAKAPRGEPPQFRLLAATGASGAGLPGGLRVAVSSSSGQDLVKAELTKSST